jgi:hypothetical protein
MDCTNVKLRSPRDMIPDCKSVRELPEAVAKRANRQLNEDLEDLMHGRPAYWLLGASFLFFSLASWFMDRFIVSSRSCLSVFVIGSYIVFSSYFMIHYFVNSMSSSYKNLDKGKQFYVLSNLIKSAALLAYSPIAAKLCYDTLYMDLWDTRRIRNLGCLYAILDFVSMILVRRMASSTWFHHACVCVFSLYSCYNDYSQETVARMMVVYAIFSVFAYLVNLLLASRFFELSPKASTILSAAALFIYVSCCSINWTWQVYYGVRLMGILENRLTLYAYTFLIVFIVYDDINLMRWLYSNVIKKISTPKNAKKKSI